jgi:SAM-dependent methyltransferase
MVAGGRVVGIDHSPGMLDQARAKAGQPSSDVLSFRQMDAERLEFPDGSFDVVLSLFALLHFPEPLDAIREMHRVLRPGGRIVVGVGEGPSLLSLSAIAQAARRAGDLVASACGRLLTAPDFLHRVMREHGLPPESSHQPHYYLPIAHLLRLGGFRHVRRHWLGRREKLGANEFWRLQITFDSPARMRLQQASSRDITSLKDDFLGRCQEVQAKNGALVYSYAAMFYIATPV